MRVTAAQAIDVKIELRRLGKGAPEMLSKLDGEISNHVAARGNFVNQKEPPRKIDHRPAQRFVHRHHRFTITIYPRLVAERLDQRLAQRDGDVFNGMMVVYLEVACANDLQIEQTVFGKEVQHVFEKWEADRDA